MWFRRPWLRTHRRGADSRAAPSAPDPSQDLQERSTPKVSPTEPADARAPIGLTTRGAELPLGVPVAGQFVLSEPSAIASDQRRGGARNVAHHTAAIRLAWSCPSGGRR